LEVCNVMAGGFQGSQPSTAAFSIGPMIGRHRHYEQPDKHERIRETISGINAACKQRGGSYAGYSCQAVFRNDLSRCMELSSPGSNITDTCLVARDMTPLFVVRSDNWNEKLGRVGSDGVALVASTGGGGSAGLAPMTLRDMLKTCGTYGTYAGLAPEQDLADDALDQQCNIRFQTIFLPMEAGQRWGSALEFTSESFNCQTQSASDPNNLLLLCTTQGVALQQDGPGKQKLFHHTVKPWSGMVARHWLEVELSDHRVGRSQTEVAQEQQDALRRGKAATAVIGTRAMGARSNVLMTVQVPLQQQSPPQNQQWPGSVAGHSTFGGAVGFGANKANGASGARGVGLKGSPFSPRSGSGVFSSASSRWHAGPGFRFTSTTQQPAEVPAASKFTGARAAPQFSGHRAAKPTGTANAARVSVGSQEDTWAGLAAKKPKRHPSQRITVTVVLYNTIPRAFPSEADIVSAIDDMERLYQSCAATDHRAAPAFAFSNFPTPTPGFVSPVPVADFAALPSPGHHIPPAPPAAMPPSTPAVPVPPDVSTSPRTTATRVAQDPVSTFHVQGREPARITSAVRNVPLNDEGFIYFHDTVGLAWLQQPRSNSATCLVEAFHAFRLADDIHVHTHGVPSATAAYNMACCLARIARDHPTLVDQIRPRPNAKGSLETGTTAGDIEPSRTAALNLALHWLWIAVACGYFHVAHAQADCDLSLVRECRHAQFQKVLQGMMLGGTVRSDDGE